MEQNHVNHLFIFGLGYSGKVLGGLLKKEGWKVSGTSRDQIGAEQLAQDGFYSYVFNDTTPIEPAILDDVTHILLSIPPNDEGDLVYKVHGIDIAKRAAQLSWIGYLSTTGVYGDHQGGWVDEKTALSPSTERGEKRVLAEIQWRSLFQSNKLPIHFFRLAGIYGPGSNQLEKVAAGKAKRRIKKDQVFSRIHVDDIAGMLIASMTSPHAGQAYNICDDEAAPPQDVVTYAAELLGVTPPPEILFNPDDMTPMGLSFFAESKRVSNEKIKHELGYKLKYPTYKQGLKALLPSIGKSIISKS